MLQVSSIRNRSAYLMGFLKSKVKQLSEDPAGELFYACFTCLTCLLALLMLVCTHALHMLSAFPAVEWAIYAGAHLLMPYLLYVCFHSRMLVLYTFQG